MGRFSYLASVPYRRALRTLVAMQIAVIEHCDEDVHGTQAIKALEECNRQWQKIMKEFTKL